MNDEGRGLVVEADDEGDMLESVALSDIPPLDVETTRYVNGLFRRIAAAESRGLSTPLTQRKTRRRRRQVSPAVRALVWERDRGLCGICHKPVDPTYWHLDHVVPRSRHGSNDSANLRVAHPRCNVTRGNKT